MNRIKGNLAVKTLVMILSVLLPIAALLSVSGFVYMFREEYYSAPWSEKEASILMEHAYQMVRPALQYPDNPEYWGPDHSNILLEIEDEIGTTLASSARDDIVVSTTTEREYPLEMFTENGDSYLLEINVRASVVSPFQARTRFTIEYERLHLLYRSRYIIPVAGCVFAVLTVVCWVFLICAAGHRKGTAEVCDGPFSKIPFDVVTAVVAGSITLLFLCMRGSYIDRVVRNFVFLLTVYVISEFYIMSFAVRLKRGTLVRESLIYKLLLLLFRGIRSAGRFIGRAFLNIGFGWKAVIFVLGMMAAEFFIANAGQSSGRYTFAVLWILIWLGVLIFLLYAAGNMQQLKKSGRRLAEGDFDYKTDTRKMLPDFREYGLDLNCIALGMNRAVEEKTKSERLKAELITNVSHDIKTPLTAIISYMDLMKKEHTDNEKLREYIEIAAKQSERLKKLTEDLVEASKASTGNLPVESVECDLNEFVLQLDGEYRERLAAKNLELVTCVPEKKTLIMADRRHLWRICDNLMNNAVKYSQRGTRVYLTLQTRGGEAVIGFRNISSQPLNIPVEELTERFVRGDSSRHTEGSGLGLSIARSLVCLQGGNLELSVDGDLFKAEVLFPLVLKNEEN